MAWIEFYKIPEQQSELGADDRARADPVSVHAEPPMAGASSAGDAAILPKQSEALTKEKTTMLNEQNLTNGHAEGPGEESYQALAKIVGVDARAAGRLDEMSADEIEEFIEDLEDCEDTLSEIDRAKAKLVRLANQKRKLKLADEAPRCEHTKTTGQRCGSPAIKGTPLCYFHGEARKQRESEAAAKAAELPVLEDMHSLQLAVMRVCALLANKAIEEKTARVLFDGLRLAQKTLAERQL